MAARTDNVSGLVVLPDRKNDAKAEKNWEGTSKGENSFLDTITFVIIH